MKSKTSINENMINDLNTILAEQGCCFKYEIKRTVNFISGYVF